MKVIVVLVIILALLLPMRLITRRKTWNLTFTLPVMKSGPMPAAEAAAPDAIAKKIEADAERLGIHLSDEDVKALADEIREAEDEAKRTGRAETSLTLGGAGRATPAAGAAAPEPTATPARDTSTHVVVVSAPPVPPAGGGAVPVTLDVEGPGGATRQVILQIVVPADRWAWLAGMRLPAWVDDGDPPKVEIEWDRL